MKIVTKREANPMTEAEQIALRNKSSYDAHNSGWEILYEEFLVCRYYIFYRVAAEERSGLVKQEYALDRETLEVEYDSHCSFVF